MAGPRPPLRTGSRVAWPRLQPDGTRCGQRRGPRLLRPAGRRAARAAASRPGSPCTTGTCRSRWRTPAAGRCATPRYRFADYAATCTTPSPTGSPTGPRSTSPCAPAFLGYAAGHHAPGRTEPEAGAPAVHHLLLGHGLAPGGDAIGARPEHQLRHHAQPVRRCRRPPTRPTTSTPPGGSTASPTGSSSTRCSAAPTRRPDRDDLALAVAVRPRPGRRPGDDRTARSTCSGINYYMRTSCVRGRTQRPRLPRHRPASASGDVDLLAPGPADRDGLGDRPRPACTTCSPGSPDDTTRRRCTITENGAAFDDVVTADGAVHDAGPGRLPATPTSARRTGHRPTASTCAATSSGR